jgi:hypothetical protein
VFDMTGCYAMIWGVTAGASSVAALLHFPIDDRPVHPAAVLHPAAA